MNVVTELSVSLYFVENLVRPTWRSSPLWQLLDLTSVLLWPALDTGSGDVGSLNASYRMLSAVCTNSPVCGMHSSSVVCLRTLPASFLSVGTQDDLRVDMCHVTCSEVSLVFSVKPPNPRCGGIL